MIRSTTRRLRPGFTLVELLVAAAVCVLIMAVLATAFQMGIDTMRSMKSTGDLTDQLRGAMTVLRADLKAPHLLDDAGQPKRLGSLTWDKCFVDTDTTKTAGTPGYYYVRTRDASNNPTDWAAPVNGFFRIGSAAIDGVKNIDEGVDADGFTSARFTNHYLHFTTVLGPGEGTYAATVRGVTYKSTAAELAYFLDPTPSGTINGTTPLYRLVRRQRLAALNDTDRRDRPWPGGPAAGLPEDRHAVLSMRKAADGQYYLNTLGELTSPYERLGGNLVKSPNYAPVTGPADDALAPMLSRPGEDTLLSNVISFEVQVQYACPPVDGKLPVVPNYPRAFSTGTPTPTATSEHPFDTFPPTRPANGNTAVPAGVYDSWTQGLATWTTDVNPTTGVVNAGPNVPPILARIQAVQIRIRIWDPKYQSARQVTIVQDL